MTELLCTGARRLLQQVIEAELAEMLERYAGLVDERGRRAVVRNGYLPEREIMTGVDPIPVKVEIWMAEDRSSAQAAFDYFVRT